MASTSTAHANSCTDIYEDLCWVPSARFGRGIVPRKLMVVSMPSLAERHNGNKQAIHRPYPSIGQHAVCQRVYRKGSMHGDAPAQRTGKEKSADCVVPTGVRDEGGEGEGQ